MDYTSAPLPTGTQSALDVPPRRPVYAATKRAFDVLAAGVGLVLVSPLLAIAATAVRLDSPGPIIFRQQRVGRNFRLFWIYKFRTMVADAEKRGSLLSTLTDQRITRVGHLLRKTKIDELPQLVNVLVGDMSLVGPRPEVPKYVEMFRADYAYVLSVRPGLTDQASVKYRDESAILAASAEPEREYINRILPDKIALARKSIAEASFLGDLGVLLRTLLRIAH